MSRMLDALKSLESRRQSTAEAPAAIPAGSAEAKWHETDVVVAPPAAAGGVTASTAVAPPTMVEVRAEALASPCVACCLPTVLEVSDRYLELAACVGDQVATNYCNVLLFVSPDRAWEACFSLTHLAQAFALQSPGDVLLVDGDMHDRRLSKAVGLAGPGLAEVMLGTVAWQDVIHPTNSQAIDFVASGARNVPTFERSQFGWNALRPQYRLVLIGVAPAGQPETTWLAARCDGVYLVVSRPDTQRPAAIAAVNGLRACGASVLGCVVVND